MAHYVDNTTLATRKYTTPRDVTTHRHSLPWMPASRYSNTSLRSPGRCPQPWLSGGSVANKKTGVTVWNLEELFRLAELFNVSVGYMAFV